MSDNNNDPNTNTTKKILPETNPAQQYKGQEGENHSTAAEGTLKTPGDQADNFGNTFKAGEENDIDTIMHAVTEEDDNPGEQATPLNKEQKFTPDDISS